MSSSGADHRGPELAWYTLRVVIAVGVAIGIVALLALLWLAVDVMLLGFAGVLLAVLLRGFANWLARHSRLTGQWSVLAVIVTLALLLGAVGWLSAPTVARQVDTLVRTLPHIAEYVQQQLRHYDWGEWLVEQIESIDWTSRRIDMVGKTTGALSSVFGTFVNVIVICFLGLYLAIQPHVYLEGAITLVPIPGRRRCRELLEEIGRTLHFWLVGTLVTMSAIGVLSGVGLWLLGVPYALALGLVAALLSFVPYLGPVLSVIPAMLIAMTKGPEYALYVAVLYLGIQFVESYLLSPVIQQFAVSLPAALILFNQIMLGILLGGMGVVLATPIAATLLVAVKMLYVEDILGDKTSERAESSCQTE